jgi:hypothetical protein
MGKKGAERVGLATCMALREVQRRSTPPSFEDLLFLLRLTGTKSNSNPLEGVGSGDKSIEFTTTSRTLSSASSFI